MEKKSGCRTTSATLINYRKTHFDNQNMTYDKSFINGIVRIQFTWNMNFGQSMTGSCYKANHAICLFDLITSLKSFESNQLTAFIQLRSLAFIIPCFQIDGNVLRSLALQNGIYFRLATWISCFIFCVKFMARDENSKEILTNLCKNPVNQISNAIYTIRSFLRFVHSLECALFSDSSRVLNLKCISCYYL